MARHPVETAVPSILPSMHHINRDFFERLFFLDYVWTGL